MDLEQEKARKAMFVVPAKIGPRGTLAAEQAVRFEREALHPLRYLRRHVGGADMLGQSGRIFGVIIIEARFNQKFGHPERLIAKHRDGEDRKSTRLNSSH